MKKTLKYITSLILIIIFAMSNTLLGFASDLPTDAIYDLQKGGTQKFLVKTPNGEIEEIIVEEISDNARIEAGTYKVSYKTSAWTAGFYVKISNNQITSAYSPFYSISIGSISSESLVLNSSKKATYSFLYKATIISYDTGVIASISNSELTISIK